MKRVLVFLADGFEEIEAIAPIDILRRAGAEVVTAGIGTRAVSGSHGITVTADVLADDDLGSFDMAVLPGGMPGTDNLEASKVVIAILREAYDNGKYIGAICAAPKILGALGMLDGRSAVVFPDYEDCLAGAKITDAAVAVDGKIITAKAAGAAMDFGFALVTALYGADAAGAIRTKMHCYG